MSTALVIDRSGQKVSSNSYTVCIATSKSPPSTATAAIHPILSLDPQTGASASLCKTGVIGIQSLELTSCYCNTSNSMFLLAYGGSSNASANNHQDNYCMLLSIDNAGTGTGGGGIKWKCRLPEHVTSNIVTSPCGQYVVAGGGVSGNCYLWSIIQKGLLINVWKCHYGPVTTVAYSDCGQYVLTGGTDGIVQVYSLLDLVSATSISGQSQPQPLHTWSEHDLQVTALCILRNSHGRFISSSNDQRLVIMELFSGVTLARIQLPSAIRCMTTDLGSHTLYLGAVNGIIYSIDLDLYAIATTVEARAILAVKNGVHSSSSKTPSTDTINSISELHGHTHPISCIAYLPSTSSSASYLDSDDTARLISGDEYGSIRIWSIKSRVCTLVLHPWSGRGSSSNDIAMDSTATSTTYPCSAILVIPNNPLATTRWNVTAATASTNLSNKKIDTRNNSSFLYPLRRFTAVQQHTDLHDDDVDGVAVASTTIQPVRRMDTLEFWEGGNMLQRKRKRYQMKQELAQFYKEGGSKHSSSTDEITQEYSKEPGGTIPNDEVLLLKQKLAEAEETITRWQAVNNKLLTKLNMQPKS
jgi:WD40 repeat protein